MSIARADVLKVASELTTALPADDERWAYYLTEADKQVNADFFGDRTTRATALMCAHLMVVDHPDLVPSESAGEVSSVSVGPVSKSFVTSSGGDGPNGGTRWGRQFDAMVQSTPNRWVTG